MTKQNISPGLIVEYEQHGNPHLAAIILEKKGKYSILNSSGDSLDMVADRLYVTNKQLFCLSTDTASKTQELKKYQTEVSEIAQKINLQELWELFSEENLEFSLLDAISFLFKGYTPLIELGTRRSLNLDKVYFKRRKDTYEPRTLLAIEELKKGEEKKRLEQEEREKLIDQISRRISSGIGEVVGDLTPLEIYAANGKGAKGTDGVSELIDEIRNRTKVNFGTKSQETAFEILVRIGHFNQHQNLIYLRAGRQTKFPDLALSQTVDLMANYKPSPDLPKLKNLRTITIDNKDTKDFDDALSIERIGTSFKVGVHIADVASGIIKDTPLDKEARKRATTVYCVDSKMPMFPKDLSEDLFSLKKGEERGVVSFFITFDETLEITAREVSKSIIQVTDQFTYDQVDEVMSDENQYDAELLDLWNIASHCEIERISRGAYQFVRKDLFVELGENFKVSLKQAEEDTPSHKLVAEMMILANESSAIWAKNNSIDLVFRSQEKPDVRLEEQGLDITEGPAREYHRRSFLKRSLTSTKPYPHFGLGIRAYAQVTSPIRRYGDLINHRQILDQGAREKGEKIEELIPEIEVAVDQANEIQRERNRYWLYQYIKQQQIKEVEGVVVKVDGPKPIVEISQLGIYFPYFTKSEVNRSILGKRISLKIELCDPKLDRLILKEI